MLLTVDIGNRFVKWGLWRDGCVQASGRVDPADETSWDALHDLPSPEKVVVGCVGDRVWQALLAQRIEQWWGITAVNLSSTPTACGVWNAYADPAKLGIDRWAAIVAAWKRWRRPVCVIDAGTALTVDVVDAAGRHGGGLIVPGVGMMRAALQQSTRDVKTDAAAVASDWGRDTESCVEAGIRRTAAALIEETCRRWCREQDEEGQCVITGGDADWIAPALGVSLHYEPLLVLEGLMHLEAEGGSR